MWIICMGLLTVTEFIVVALKRRHIGEYRSRNVIRLMDLPQLRTQPTIMCWHGKCIHITNAQAAVLTCQFHCKHHCGNEITSWCPRWPMDLIKYDIYSQDVMAVFLNGSYTTIVMPHDSRYNKDVIKLSKKCFDGVTPTAGKHQVNIVNDI